MTRYDHKGGAKPTALATGINSSATSLTGNDLTGWPTGADGPFWFALGAGTSSEEHCTATGRTGNNLTGVTRGLDDTTAAEHTSGVSLEHTSSALEFDEANAHIEDDTRDDHGQYAKTDGTRAFTGPVQVTSEVAVNGTAGSEREVDFGTAGSNRWALLANSTAEAGSDAGSDFEVEAYDDSGTLIDKVLTIGRVAGGLATWLRSLVAPSFKASGLTGATAASRYVGATASGAPASGTFAVGDYIVDQSGAMYVCTTAGSPGTWTQVGNASSGALVLIEEQTLASAAASVTFSSIPQTYLDLVVVATAREVSASGGPGSLNLRLNGSSSSDYDYQIDAMGTSTRYPAVVTAATEINVGLITRDGDTADKWAYTEMVVADYTATDKDKLVKSESVCWVADAGSPWKRDINGIWRPATVAAVTSLSFHASTNLKTGSKFALYGRDDA